jgi:hypothetical protein
MIYLCDCRRQVLENATFHYSSLAVNLGIESSFGAVDGGTLNLR